MPTAKTQPRKTLIPVHIRWMIRRDMPEVLAIEDSFGPHAWSEEDFLHVLRQRNCIGMVAEHRALVVGFMVYELHPNKLQLLDFAVHPFYRRGRVGAQMVEKLVSKLHPNRRNKIMLEVREANLGGQLFFKAMGFRATRVVRNFYETCDDDAYRFRYLYRPER